MPQRRNEISSQIRSEPMAYSAAYDASNNTEYEGWADPGSAQSAAVWIICKHTYDASNNHTRTQWAQSSPVPPASFDQIWDNRSSLTYV